MQKGPIYIFKKINKKPTHVTKMKGVNTNMFTPVHQTHQCSLYLHHRTTLSVGTHGCWDSAAPGGSVEVYDSSSHQTDRGNLHNHHNGHLWTHTVHWHIEIVHVDMAPLLKDQKNNFIRHFPQCDQYTHSLFFLKLTTAGLVRAI